ncbi:cation/acetate symporter [Georgenia satyanarayanai]|uniref:Cation/acetate symporter n=1 Tax=Georgenia satyanarayanai TaxID=860221 RepID=A0A2Y9AD55_9MICO|nr:cation acetate symporter [Georgenia satyanarayanai]PYG00138.1 cation/acetate symporter [Georgenia satyanarayanai]SSA40217.1 cation/acetate symporter [Georgenia satyanarayanai]
MSPTAVVTLTAVVVVVLGVSVATRPRSSSTVDFYLAGQRVGVVTNSWAICGDYLSAASFLGVAAAVYVSGLDGAWYAVGFAAGFVPVLLFVAAPLRRFGEFSLADFLGRRLESDAVRLSAVGVVQLVILCYLVPQSVGGGITWELLVGHGLFGFSPYATGVLLSTAVVAVVVAYGGMRGTTWNQAVQFLLLFSALLWLAVTVTADGFHLTDVAPLETVGTPDGLAVAGGPAVREGRLGQVALVVTLALGTAGLPHVMNRYFTSPTGRAARTTTLWVLVLVGAFYALAVVLGTAARDVIPAAVAEHAWLEELTEGGVLLVPEHALPVLGRIYGGEAGLGLVAAAALIAALSTVAGLLLASAATWGHDVYERYLNPRATQRQAVRAGRVTTLVGACLAAGLAVLMRPDGFTPTAPSLVATMVTWAFAVAGSALTPVVVLSIWWRGMTAAAAAAGMLTGATLAVTLFITAELMPASPVRDLVSAPTPVAASVAVVVIVLVSRRSARPAGTGAAWLTMHGTAADRQAERLARMMVDRGRGRRR